MCKDAKAITSSITSEVPEEGGLLEYFGGVHKVRLFNPL